MRRPLSLSLSLALFLSLTLSIACGSSSTSTPDTLGADAVVADAPVEDAPLAETLADAPAETTADEGPAGIDWDAFFAPRGWTDDGKTRVVVLHTNDMHSFVQGLGPQADFSPDALDLDGTIGGFSRLASLIERERRDPRPGASVVAVDAGDFTFGSAFASLARTKGLELHLMEAMGYTATTLGNHEMDWSPQGTARVVNAGIEDATNLQILASNLVFADGDAADDDLEKLMGKKIHPYRVVTLDNGVKVGLFGLLGEGALKLAPHADPVTIRKPAAAAQEMIDYLRTTEKVDLVVGLSHGGIGEGTVKGEDETLAGQVTGLDVLVTGHSHTLPDKALKIGTTLVVQAGNYGRFLGRLTLVKNGAAFELESWEALPVDDATPGLPEVEAKITAAAAELDGSLFKGLGYGFETPVATTGFDLLPVEFAEYGLGDLVADAVRWATSQHDPEGPVQVVFEANGVIRDGIKKGKTGEVRVADLFQVLPLGLGPNDEIGYPMLAFYLTPYEIKAGLEVIVGIAPAIADSFFLQVSGLKFEYDTDGGLLSMVQNVWLGNEEDGYDATPLDITPENKQLIRVATNLYIAQMLGVIKTYTGIAIDLKDKDGKIYENLTDAMVDADPDTAGVQEYKLWRTLVDYLRSQPVESGATLPKIPARYEKALGRMKEI